MQTDGGHTRMCDDLQAALLPWVEGRPAGQVFVLADEHTHALCLPRLLERAECLRGAHVVTVPAGATEPLSVRTTPLGQESLMSVQEPSV